MAITRERKSVLTAEEIAAVKLSNRLQYGEYVRYTALSRDGHTEYAVVARDGKAVSCTCPATVECRHMVAVTFEEAWIAPVVTETLGEMAQDLTEHVEDDLTSHADEYAELAEQAEAIIAAEKAAKIREGIIAVEVELIEEDARLLPFTGEPDLTTDEPDLVKCALNAPREPKMEEHFGRMILMR
jgi:hypothetical protein